MIRSFSGFLQTVHTAYPTSRHARHSELRGSNAHLCRIPSPVKSSTKSNARRYRLSSSARLAVLLLALPLLLAAASTPALRQVAVLDLPGRPGFDEIALVHGMLLVSHPGAGVVDLFDPKKRRVAGRILDMSSPRGVAVDEASHRVYIANSGARNIVVASTETWQVERTIPLDSAPDSLLVAPAEHLLYVTLPASQTVAAIDLSANAQLVSRVTLAGHPRAMAYDARRHQLWVTVQDRRRVQVLGPSLRPVASYLLNASEPTGIAFSRLNDRVYVAARYAVLALNPETGAEVSRSAVASGIDQLLLDEPSHSLLGVSDGSVFFISVSATLGEASELKVAVTGHTLAYDASTGYFYLPGSREGRSKLLILKRYTAANSASR